MSPLRQEATLISRYRYLKGRAPVLVITPPVAGILGWPIWACQRLGALYTYLRRGSSSQVGALVRERFECDRAVAVRCAY
jgi:hypothetical protein